jgi:hypothetical protein
LEYANHSAFAEAEITETGSDLGSAFHDNPPRFVNHRSIAAASLLNPRGHKRSTSMRRPSSGDGGR